MKTCHIKSISSIFGFGVFLAAMLGFFTLAPVTIYAQWNTNTSVNITISGLPTADIQAAPTSDGKTWIAFYHQNAGNYDMRAQLIDANGYKLLGPDGMLVDNKPSGSATYVFNVCVDPDNNFIIGYQDERTGSMKSVVYKISQAGVHLWGTNGVVLGGGLAPYPTALSNGEVVVAWNGDSGNTLNIQKITSSGSLAWSNPLVVLVGTSTTTRGQLIANLAGKFTMVYQVGNMYTTLYAQMFNNSGTALYPPLQIGNQTTAAYRYYSIIAEGDTTYYGYYSSTGMRFNSFLQRVNPNGTIPWGMNGSNFNTSVASTDNYQGETSINMTPGANYVWSVCNFSNPNQTIYGVYVQKFLKTTGVRQFSDQAKVVYPISGNKDQRCGNLEVVSDNPMFLSYNSTEKIFATRLDGSGNFVWPGNRIEVSSTTAGGSTPKMRYCFTPDGPNKFACTWTEDRGPGYMGYAQGVSVGGLIGLTVATEGGVPATITSSGGTLQMVATVFPSTANQAVTWNIIPGTGMATISAAGLVTAVSNGTAYAKATAVQDPTVVDSLMIAISGQTAQPPLVITLPATTISSSGATLNGAVNANNLSTNVSFDWGLTTAYGNTIDATPSVVTGTIVTAVMANLTGLSSSTTYHYRVKGTNAAGPATGADFTFKTDAGVGVSENDPLKMDIYPVPNNGCFNISIVSGSEKTFSLDVFNSLGTKIYTKSNITVQGNSITAIDIRPVPAGFYTLILRSAGEQKVFKFMID
ncbi:MAG: Ig-like domain-containing protein [Bacteroidetes bacterium]|nr:Ig-like domain-containing protein [Bacteroidota bacterium]